MAPMATMQLHWPLWPFWLGAEGGHKVGTGVVDPNGGPPEDMWHLTITLFDDPFRDVSLGLISGRSVRSADAEVQISFKAVSKTRLNIRIRDADPVRHKQVLDLVVDAVDPDDLDHPDPRGIALPVPNGWQKIRSDTDTTSDWELYNCRIRSVKISNP
jgi:hypothetical protein